MNRQIAINQLNNHVHHNTKFLRGTPRTCREAFGSELQRIDRDGWVFIAVMACVAVAAFVGLKAV